MPVTLKDLAEKTGYSITTVSRALAGYDDVNAKTRQHIMDTAVEMGYQPNMIARQLRSQRTQTLGLIIPFRDQSFSNDFFHQLMLGIGDQAALAGYDLLISAQTPGEHEMAAYQRIVGGNRVDGMILARTRHHDPRIAYLKKLSHPFVVYGRSAPDESSDFPYIDVDSQVGIQSAVTHLIEQGHQHIGLLLPPEEMAFTEYRLQGYRSALEASDLPYEPGYVLYGDLLCSGGYTGAQTLLDHFPQLTALAACNDLMALGAMSAVQAQGRIIGQEFGITGFDDIPAAEYAHPPLTTIRQPIYEIGQRLVQMLLGIIDGEPLHETQFTLKPELIVRISSLTM